MLLDTQTVFRMLALAVLLNGAMLAAAHAEEEDHEGFSAAKSSGKYGGENRGKPLQPAQLNGKFKQECSACHIAYAPGLLPAASWRKVMAGLDQHFGSDASLSEQENREISAFLVGNASNRWSVATAPLRITESAWFTHKHDGREIPAKVWKNPKVNSPANCAACHPRAESGNFSERDIRIPK